MESIRRNIKLFFVAYGSLLFYVILIILVFLFILHEVNIFYKENVKEKLQANNTTEEEITKNHKLIQEEKENKLFISKFIDYCNENKVEEAYNMLSGKYIEEKYLTIEKFKNKYIDKIFEYKKEYKIDNINNIYEVKIMEDILKSGKIENRDSITIKIIIENNVPEKNIYIEGIK